jgi:PTH1 family peptidyl-tRNA hydrolase
LTRHNVGFLVLDAWADEEGWRFATSAPVSRSSCARFGRAAGEADDLHERERQGRGAWLDWLKLTVADLLVVVDDVALPLGQVRLQAGGFRGRAQRAEID